MSAPFPCDCAARFRAERLIARGGFGSVWLATQIDLERPVAIKLLHADLLASPEDVERFQAEARITASLNHPGIVRVIDHGCAEVPWIAYEYLPGRSLAQVLAGGALAWPAALSVAAQVAGALDEAHAHDVLHRDIKPSNILEAAPGLVKVADFGIAKWERSEALRTASGMILGTPTYIAPEHVEGRPFSARSDVYAAGIVLYEMLTGDVPFRHEHPHVVLQMHAGTPAPPPSSRRADLPRELDALVLGALAKDPAARYPSAGAFREAILVARAAIEGGEASGDLIPAGPVRAPEPSSQPVRRSRRTRRLAAVRPGADATQVAAVSGASRVLPDPSMRPLLLAATFVAIVLLALVHGLEQPVVQKTTPSAAPSGSAPPAPALTAGQRLDAAVALTELAAGLCTARPVESLMATLTSTSPDLPGAARDAAEMERVESARQAAVSRVSDVLEQAVGERVASALPADRRLVARARALQFACWHRVTFCRIHARAFGEFARAGDDTVLALMDLNLALSKPADRPQGLRLASAYLAAAAPALRGLPDELAQDPLALEMLLADLRLVARTAGAVRWTESARASVRGAAEDFKRELANDPRPAVYSLARAAANLWEWGSAPTQARAKALLERAAEDVRMLGTQIPAAAPGLERVAESLTREARP